MGRISGPRAFRAGLGESRDVPRWLEVILRVPLAGKLAGANALIVLVAVGVALAINGVATVGSQLALLLGLALGGSLVVNVVLVLVALRPLRDLEITAERIWHGDYAARVPDSLLADRDMARVGGALNEILDGLTADRARLRQLASEVIRVGERERSVIARELHDSVAQSLAALLFQISVAARETTDPVVSERIATLKRIATDVLEEIRLLAQTVHPRVLDDLGLVAALHNLVRVAGERSGVELAVEANEVPSHLSPTLGSVLYRVAQEAIANALKHGAPSRVCITLGVAERGFLRLEITDDGRGFDVDEAARRRPGMGLFTMRERVALVDGRFTIESAAGNGTRVMAEVPLEMRETS